VELLRPAMCAVIIGLTASVSGTAAQPRDSVAVNLGQDEIASKGEKLMEVVVTGLGQDPDKALQNAFSHAIEQAVGVLVDAETIVKNDKLVSEQVLTHSRGFVQHYDVVRRWERSGLHHCRIRAKVALVKLGEKLKANKIALRRVAGEWMYLQSMQELDAAQQAADLFRRTVADYTYDKLFKVEIVGKPEQTAKDDVNATLRVRVRVLADMDNWRKFYDQVTPVLRKLATKRTTFAQGAYRDAENRFGKRTPDTTQIAVLRTLAKGGTRAGTWDAYRVPITLRDVMTELNDQPYRVHIALLGPEDRPVWEVERKLCPRKHSLAGRRGTFNCLAPLFWTAGMATRQGKLQPFAVHEEEVKIELEKLRHVTKCVAFIKNTSPLPSGSE